MQSRASERISDDRGKSFSRATERTATSAGLQFAVQRLVDRDCVISKFSMVACDYEFFARPYFHVFSFTLASALIIQRSTSSCASFGAVVHVSERFCCEKPGWLHGYTEIVFIFSCFHLVNFTFVLSFSFVVFSFPSSSYLP